MEWEDELAQLFAAYVDAKQAQHILDFDDLLLYWDGMLADEALAAEVASLFDHVLVDEYQDTNRLQGSILARLKPTGEGVTVVGDDAQAIYGFRAAEVRNILDFPSLFEPPATTMTLDVNYRSAQAILDASNAVMSHAAERFTKNLTGVRGIGERPLLVTVKDESDQARYVAEDVLACREQGMPLKSQAVLFRTSSHSAPLELELARRNIPFVKYGGLKFLDAAHVKDVLCALRWAHNPRDRLAAYRVLRLLPGIGPANATRLGDRMADGAEVDDAVAAARVARNIGRRSSRCLRGCARRRRAGPPTSTTCSHGTSRIFMRIHEDGPSRALDLFRVVAHRGHLSVARALPHRDHARSAIRQLGHGGRAAHRRRLPHPVDHPFGERAGMAQREHSQRRGRMHPVGHGDRTRGGHRGGAAAALRRDDARARPPCDRRAAAVLRRAAVARRRPARLRVAQPLPHRGGVRHARPRDVARAVDDAANEKPHAAKPRAAVDVAARIRDAWRSLR